VLTNGTNCGACGHDCLGSGCTTGLCNATQIGTEKNGSIPTSVAVYLALPSLRGRRLRDVARLLWLGPLDFFLYRPILLWAGVRGLWGFLRGEKAWGKLTRNARTVEN